MIDPRAPLHKIIQRVKEMRPSLVAEELLDALYCQGLTSAELRVHQATGQLMSDFSKLDQMHPADVPEFMFHIHALQNIIQARAAQRAHPDQIPSYKS